MAVLGVAEDSKEKEGEKEAGTDEKEDEKAEPGKEEAEARIDDAPEAGEAECVPLI